jgi:hypothetical protein
VLLTDAFGGFGGIAKFNRDFLRAVAGSPNVSGVVAIPRTLVADVVEKSVAREAKEASILKRLGQGERTLDIYNF